MSQDKAEIQRQIDHQQKILVVWRGHAEHVELQIAKSGFDVSSKLVQELREYQEQIKLVESRIDELEIQAVEEDYSLAEAEYRVMAAEAWENGYLTTLGMAQLELTRLRLQMPLEKALQIQCEVRVNLVRDIFRTIHSIDFHTQIQQGASLRGVERVYKAMRLDYKEFLRLLAQTENLSDELLELIVKNIPQLIDHPFVQEEVFITKQELLEAVINSESEKLLNIWNKYPRLHP